MISAPAPACPRNCPTPLPPAACLALCERRPDHNKPPYAGLPSVSTQSDQTPAAVVTRAAGSTLPGPAGGAFSLWGGA